MIILAGVFLLEIHTCTCKLHLYASILFSLLGPYILVCTTGPFGLYSLFGPYSLHMDCASATVLDLDNVIGYQLVTDSCLNVDQLTAYMYK